MILSYVPPCLAPQHVANAAVTNVIRPGELCHGRAALSVAPSRVSNLFFGELCVRVTCPTWLAVLCHFVSHVVSACTQEEMGRIATRRIVALVTNYKAIWNGPIRQFIRDTVSQKRLTTAADVDAPIAKTICAALPFPAFVGAKAMHLRPKSIGVGAEPRVMAMNKTKWLAFYMAASVFVPFCNTCFLPTSAVAVSVWNFFWGFVRGIIVHVNSLLLAVGHSVGLLAQSPRFFVVLQVYYSTFVRIFQARRVA